MTILDAPRDEEYWLCEREGKVGYVPALVLEELVENDWARARSAARLNEMKSQMRRDITRISQTLRATSTTSSVYVSRARTGLAGAPFCTLRIFVLPARPATLLFS